MYRSSQLVVIILCLFSQNIVIIRTCSVMKITKPEELISQAAVIVRARAVDYEKVPDDQDAGTDEPSTSAIRFVVEEIIKSNVTIPDPLLIGGSLNKDDDFNPQSSPYKFARPGDRSGGCFANTYKQNASFLLFLDNEYTPYWSALAPVNEQLYSPSFTDSWLQWVKNHVTPKTRERNIDQHTTSSANKIRPFFF